MANHLFIGLGGTGGKTLRAMRKRIFEEFGTNDPQVATHAEFIYVDSDENDLNDNKSWKYMGNPVHLSPGQKVNIHGIGGNILNNLNAYPGLRAFLTNSDREQLRNNAVAGIIDTGIGGQRRRFGRILMANNVTANQHSGFSATLRERIINFTHANQGEGNITFHIIAGLAGGTGSGSIVDAVAQLHKIIEPMGAGFEIYLYLYVPEILVPARENAGFYHANGYAALQELNALSIGSYHPTDISGQIDAATGQVRRLIKGGHIPAFKMAYLFTDRNEAANVLEKKRKLPMAVADFLFQKTFGQEQGANCQMGRLTNVENNAIPPEMNEEGEPVHGRKFMTFGIVRIIYPESEIKSFASDKCTESVLRGLNYNLWVIGSGFKPETDEAAGNGIAIEVRTPAYQETMMLHPEYLTLERPIADYPGTENYSTFQQYWTTFCNFIADDIVNGNANKNEWIGMFDEACNSEYTENFRNLGVHKFFTNQRTQQQVNNFAAIICNHIEDKLFGEWINGLHNENQRMSLQKVGIYLRELEAATQERIPNVNARIAGLTQSRNDAANLAAEFLGRFNNNGLFGGLIGWTRRDFLNYVSAKRDVMICNTAIEACQFSALALEQIVVRLGEMRSSVVHLQNMINAATTEAAENAEIACQPYAQVNGEVEIVVKRFDPEAVRASVRQELVNDEALQTQLLQETRQRLNTIAQNAGKPTLFRSLYEALGGQFNDEENVSVLLTTVTDTTRNSITNQLNNIANDNNGNALLGVNILDKLKNELVNEEQVEHFVADNILTKVKCFLQFDAAEVGADHGEGPVQIFRGVQVILPQYNDPTNFRTRFFNAIQSQFGVGLVNPDSLATSPEGKENEIVIITAASGFPLRVVQNLNFMKQKYDELVSHHNNLSELNKVLLHTETLTPQELPSLFGEDPAYLRRRMELLAIKIHSLPDFVINGVDPQSGDEVNTIIIGRGFNALTLMVGDNAVQTAQMLENDPALRAQLRDVIDERIAETYRTRVERQNFAGLIEDMVCRDVLNACGGNRLSPVFREFVNVAQEYLANLN